jgi:hypothetical protein
MDYRQEARRIASEFGIDPDLFVNLVQAESSFIPDNISEDGAVGLTQIMPNTALKPGYNVTPIENRLDPLDNLRFGAEYYKAMLDEFGSNELALAAYNAGPGNLEKILNREKPMESETQKYVKNILGVEFDPENKFNIRRRKVATIDPSNMGASGIDLDTLLNSQYGALTPELLAALSGSKDKAVQAIALTEALTPKAPEVDPAMASLLYFTKMGELASQPGATTLGSISGAFSSPAEYLQSIQKRKEELEASKPGTAASFAKALKAPTTFGQPGSYVQSVLKYRNGVAVQTLKDGTTIVVGKDQQVITDPEEIKKAIDEGIASGVMEKADMAGVSKAQEAAVALSTKNFEEIGKINVNIANFEAGIRAINEGADTGYFESFIPNLTAASIELNNVIGRLALDVVGSVTFGALSQGELNLARDVGAPSSLQEEDLRNWFQERIDAKRKLVDYLTQQAMFLSDGTKTIGDWKKKLQDDGFSPSANIFEKVPTDEAQSTSSDVNEITAEDEATILRIKTMTNLDLANFPLPDDQTKSGRAIRQAWLDRFNELKEQSK